MNKKTLIGLVSLILVLFIGAFFFGYYKTSPSRSLFDVSPDIVSAFEPDFIQLSKMASERMPDIVILGLEGPVDLQQVSNGRPTLINFWATWCAPCVTELPLLEKLNAHYDNLQVIAISLDGFDDPQVLKGYLEERDIGFFAAYTDQDKILQGKLALRGLPTSILLDTQGKARYAFMGDADWMSTESLTFFDAVLGLEAQ